MKLTVFTAKWCKPCSTMKVHLDKLLKERQSISLELVDVEKDPDRARIESIKTIPTLIRDDGTRLAGAQTLEKLRDWLAS